MDFLTEKTTERTIEMSNPLYQEMMQNAINNNPMQILSQLRQNPIQFVISRGFNVPANVGNDPNAIIQHLMNTGQVSQEKYNQAVQMARNFMR